MLSVSEIGHWKYGLRFDPRQWFGFLYCIRNGRTNRFYIGKKQFYHGGKKRSRSFGKEMAWRTYTGSSASLKRDIDNYGKSNFDFEIIDLYKTRGGLYYAEAYLQMLSDCMTEVIESTGKPRFYNRQIAAIRFVPKEVPTNKSKNYIKKIKRRINGKDS